MATSSVKHQGWIASLSDGETVFQTENVLGERSAWGKLVDKCAEEGLWVTQMQLQINSRTIVGIKNAAGYCHFMDVRVDGLRQVGGTPMKETRHVGIGSVVGNNVYCTLVNEQGQSWQDSRPLASMRAHCILRQLTKTSDG
jgi:hypothetical protein